MFKSENTDLMLKRVWIAVAEAALVNNLASSSGIRVILHLPVVRLDHYLEILFVWKIKCLRDPHGDGRGELVDQGVLAV